LQKRFNDVKRDAYNCIDLKTNKLLTSSVSLNKPDICVKSFAQRITQVSFIQKSVEELMAEGIAAEDIVLILPDESFAEVLKNYDDKHNFNFAMGLSVRSSYALRLLDATCAYLNTPSVENQQRLKRYDFQCFEQLSALYYDEPNVEQFSTSIKLYSDLEQDKAVKKIIEDELAAFVKIMPELKGLSMQSLLHLFLKRCYEQNSDDVRGGKVTVMGVLESRGIAYEGVIVVDFNEDVVPHKSEKDLFLNSALKKYAGLPTTQDRENLQRHYYSMLFMQAKSVKLSYVLSEVEKPSRFLLQLKLPLAQATSDEQYIEILHPKKQIKPFVEQIQEVAFDFSTFTFSASSLKRYLECKRSFYYRYVLKLHGHELPVDVPKEHAIGNALHEALHKLYAQQNSYSDKTLLQKDFEKRLFDAIGSSVLEKYQLKLWLEKLQPFFENEYRRFSAGIEVFTTEESLNMTYKGMKLSGKIDRIDLVDKRYLQVIDYKSGSYKTYSAKTYEKATDFQLEFYELLAEANFDYELERAYGSSFFYDLNKGILVKEGVKELKMQQLDVHLQSLQKQKSFLNEKCEDLSLCTYCDYKFLCDRA